MRSSLITVHGIRACIRTSRCPSLVTQRRKHAYLDVVPRDEAHEACVHDHGTRTRHRSHELRAYGSESVDEHSLPFQSMNEDGATCRWKPGSTAAHSVAATLHVRSSDLSASLSRHVRERSADVRRGQVVVDDNRLLQD
ncbi:hypothetical protein M3J09_010118 [Ascochyta lentis]